MAPELLECEAHGTPTRLRCAEAGCDQPICPQCLVKTSVGLKCQEHAQAIAPNARLVSYCVDITEVNAFLASPWKPAPLPSRQPRSSTATNGSNTRSSRRTPVQCPCPPAAAGRLWLPLTSDESALSVHAAGVRSSGSSSSIEKSVSAWLSRKRPSPSAVAAGSGSGGGMTAASDGAGSASSMNAASTAADAGLPMGANPLPGSALVVRPRSASQSPWTVQWGRRGGFS